MLKRLDGASWVCRMVTTQVSQSSALTDNFELASLPTTTPEERKRLLSFVICGGGPTGVETAAVSRGIKNI